MRCSRSPLTMDVGQLVVQALQHARLQLGETLGLRVHLLHGDLGGLAQPDAERRRQGARAEAALLAAAHDQRHQPHARLAADVERADALGPVDLVAGDAHQVDVHRLDVERDLAGGLRRVGVEEGLLLAADLADLGERLDDADLVVHRHDRDDHGLVGDGRAQLRRDRSGRSSAPADRSPRSPAARDGGRYRARTCARSRW